MKSQTVNLNQSYPFLFYAINVSNSPIIYFDNGSSPSELFQKQKTIFSDKLNLAENLSIVERLTVHITLIVSIIGLIGNACTIIVLNRQSMRKWRSSMLLSSLAAVDFLYLLIIFLSIIDELTKQTLGFHKSLILCQVTVYITHVCSFLSASYTLSFTLQRFVAVVFPLHAHTIISTRSSITNIILLIFFGCTFYSFSFFVTNISSGQCREDEKYPVLFPLLIVDICLTFVLPFTFILIFNFAIVFKLKRRKRFEHDFDGSLMTRTTVKTRHRRTSFLEDGPDNNVTPEQEELCQRNPDRNESNSIENGDKIPDQPITPIRKVPSSMSEVKRKINNYSKRLSMGRASIITVSNELIPVASNPNNSRQAISQRTTKMLVICSTTFLLFNSPYCAVLFYSFISGVVFTRALGILRHFYFMSFCLNFFLYSLWGHRFREEFILLMKECRQHIHLPWLGIHKVPKQSNLARTTTRTMN